jgi:cell division cycle 20-like protein 1 (cofactor of APC complex)
MSDNGASSPSRDNGGSGGPHSGGDKSRNHNKSTKQQQQQKVVYSDRFVPSRDAKSGSANGNNHSFDEDELRAFEDDDDRLYVDTFTRDPGRDDNTHEETTTTRRTPTRGATANGNNVRTVVANTEREDTSAAYHELLRSELQLPTNGGGGGERGQPGNEAAGESGNNAAGATAGSSGHAAQLLYDGSPLKETQYRNKKTLRFKTDSPPSSGPKKRYQRHLDQDGSRGTTGGVNGENNDHHENAAGVVSYYEHHHHHHSTNSPSPYSLSPIGRTGPLGTALAAPRRTPRKIARSPFKVLDAPALQDDFYLNLVDWSSHNVLAVGLGSCVYLWSAFTSRVTKLCDLAPSDSICSVAWTQRGTFLAVGTNTGDVQIWDAHKCKLIRTMTGHRSRVGTLAWSTTMLSSGSRDRSIMQRDVRSPEQFTGKLLGHKSEVCGLKWSYDDRELASGGNDNQLLIWSASASSGGPALRLPQHQAAVKAISWSPHQHGLLASGGGTADRCIRFWNTTTNTPLQCVDTGSQVCNLAWSKNVNEIVSTHGYSQNQIVVWRYPTMSKLATLTGHTLRVLYLAVSPDGQTIVTGAGDETLRFWNVFPGQRSQGGVQENSVWNLNRTQIR